MPPFLMTFILFSSSSFSLRIALTVTPHCDDPVLIKLVLYKLPAPRPRLLLVFVHYSGKHYTGQRVMRALEQQAPGPLPFLGL